MGNSPAVKEALEAANLKYMQVEDEYGLFFRGDHRDDMVVVAKEIDDYVLVHTAVPEFPAEHEETVARNYLHLTFNADMFKLARRASGEYTIAAEFPLTLVTPRTLEAAIRGAVHLVDLRPEDLLSLEAMQPSNLAVSLRTATLLEPEIEAVEEGLPDLLADLGIHPRVGWDGKAFLFDHQMGDLQIALLAVSQRAVVSLVAFFSDLRPSGDLLAYYRKMADANLQMDVCKVALSDEDTVAFMYQVPIPDAAALRQALERLEVYIPTTGMLLL
ncbi:MAG: hypothetical protein H5T59_11715 [Anaerolineae bacterium]|nr:hypothetical protein [Anaerolineae bacterium]